MKKNSFRYREDLPSDTFEEVIDLTTGKREEIKPAGDAGAVMRKLLDWSVQRRGGGFVNVKKQYRAMALMRKANIAADKAKERWIELENQDYYKEKGLDWMVVCSSFDRKPCR